MTYSPFRAILACTLAFVLTACSHDKDSLPVDNPFKSGKSERELRLEADGLYKLARRSLDTADFQGAIQRYDQILLKYPFSDYATQAQLESIYAKYRAFDAEGALSTAERFLKEHPRHPAGDYAWYLKGLINFQRGESAFDWMVDSTRQDVGFAQQAFDDFGVVVQRYPNSRYAADARLRMIHLRNRIAAHELSVVKYYVRRGAPIAAAKRAEKIIADYPGAPVELETLALLEGSYRKVGLDAQADDVQRLINANRGVVPAAETPREATFWQHLFGVEPPPPPQPQPDPRVTELEGQLKTLQAQVQQLEQERAAEKAAAQAQPVPEPPPQPAPAKKKKKTPTRPRTPPSADSADPGQTPAQ